ncbi:unnamed protein product [Peniophora sp. CBMAI 1063]|nr:unnamed protein product [Peniophora sp. CBMAI 1063]
MSTVTPPDVSASVPPVAAHALPSEHSLLLTSDLRDYVQSALAQHYWEIADLLTRLNYPTLSSFVQDLRLLSSQLKSETLRQTLIISRMTEPTATTYHKIMNLLQYLRTDPGKNLTHGGHELEKTLEWLRHVGRVVLAELVGSRPAVQHPTPTATRDSWPTPRFLDPSLPPAPVPRLRSRPVTTVHTTLPSHISGAVALPAREEDPTTSETEYSDAMFLKALLECSGVTSPKPGWLSSFVESAGSGSVTLEHPVDTRNPRPSFATNRRLALPGNMSTPLQSPPHVSASTREETSGRVPPSEDPLDAPPPGLPVTMAGCRPVLLAHTGSPLHTQSRVSPSTHAPVPARVPPSEDPVTPQEHPIDALSESPAPRATTGHRPVLFDRSSYPIHRPSLALPSTHAPISERALPSTKPRGKKTSLPPGAETSSDEATSGSAYDFLVYAFGEHPLNYDFYSNAYSAVTSNYVVENNIVSILTSDGLHARRPQRESGYELLGLDDADSLTWRSDIGRLIGGAFFARAHSGANVSRMLLGPVADYAKQGPTPGVANPNLDGR